MITDRDKASLDFIEKFRIAKIAQVAQVGYENDKNVANRRFKKFVDDGMLHRKRNVIEQGYLYATDKKYLRSFKQYYHYMLRNEAYIKFLEHTEILQTMVEEATGTVRCDMTIAFKYKDRSHVFMVEVDTENNGTKIDYNKYNNFLINEWQNYFNAKPIVLYITSRRISKEKANYCFKVVDLKFKNFEAMLNDL